jgi:aminomethyltransferase
MESRMTSFPQQQTLQQTVLNAAHRAAGARLVDFAGWDMPVHYGSQVEEHHAVRGSVGVFDVGHMRALDIDGADAEAFLRRALANDVARLTPGRALYSCMLDQQAGILDDLIVYSTGEARYRIVLNAATALADLAWLQQHVGSAKVGLKLRDDLTILAVQGPRAVELLPPLLPPALAAAAPGLRPFSCTEDGDWFVGRTGYTGEDGFELVFPAAEADAFWATLLAAGIRPCGLGARDTLRLEAGMNLYGQDMDTGVTPMECGLAWTVHREDAARDFIGRVALEAATPRYRQIGLVLDTRGVLRGHMKLRFANGATGETTSGSFSPTIGKAVALARVDAGASGEAEVEIRGQWHAVRQVKPPFVRNGQIKI